MKKLSLVFLMIISSITFTLADENEKGKNFKKVKASALEGLEKRLQHLQQTKSCVSGASDHKALKACRSESRKKGEALRSEMKQKRESFKAERMQRKAERKKNKEK